jgi:hypothetical protein
MSFTATDIAMYSASVETMTVTDCVDELHITGPPFKRVTVPEVDLLVSTTPAKSLSEKVVGEFSFLCPYYRP